MLHFVLPVFYQLCQSRDFRDGQPRGIPPSEILAWSTLNGCRLRPWEVELLSILDRSWLKAMQPEPAA